MRPSPTTSRFHCSLCSHDRETLAAVCPKKHKRCLQIQRIHTSKFRNHRRRHNHHPHRHHSSHSLHHSRFIPIPSHADLPQSQLIGVDPSTSISSDSHTLLASIAFIGINPPTPVRNGTTAFRSCSPSHIQHQLGSATLIIIQVDLPYTLRLEPLCHLNRRPRSAAASVPHLPSSIHPSRIESTHVSLHQHPPLTGSRNANQLALLFKLASAYPQDGRHGISCGLAAIAHTQSITTGHRESEPNSVHIRAYSR